MKLFLLIIGACVALTANSQNEVALNVFPPEAERFRYMTTSNISTLDKFLSDELVYIHSNGFEENKESHLESISSGKIHYDKMEIEQSDYFTKSKFAFTNGIVRVKGSYNATAFDIRLRYTAVYRKHKCVWKLLRWQSTKLP